MAKRKRKVRGSIKVIGVLALLIVLCGGTMAVLKMFAGEEKPAVSAEPEATVEPTPEPTPEVTNASLFMVGDALLHTTIERDVANGDGTYSFTLLDRIGEIAKNYDLKFANQETILGGDERGIQGYPTFNGPTAWGDYMVEKGFNLISTANNHTLDQGVEGVEHSINYWKSKEGVVTSGTYATQEEADAIEVHEVNGIRYAFIAYTYGMNGFMPPADRPYLVSYYQDAYGNTIQEKVDELMNKVRSAKEQADVVIVSMHWGVEYAEYATDDQQNMAQQLADAGADIIIGNHAHAIQPVQWLNGGKSIVFYALGNVCAAQYDKSRIEMMAGLNIQKTTNPDGSVEIALQDLKTDLMYCYYRDGAIDQFDVIPFSQMDDAHLYGYQSVYEEKKQIITALDSSIPIGGF